MLTTTGLAAKICVNLVYPQQHILNQYWMMSKGGIYGVLVVYMLNIGQFVTPISPNFKLLVSKQRSTTIELWPPHYQHILSSRTDGIKWSTLYQNNFRCLLRKNFSFFSILCGKVIFFENCRKSLQLTVLYFADLQFAVFNPLKCLILQWILSFLEK